jgi:hypothetical protein
MDILTILVYITQILYEPCSKFKFLYKRVIFIIVIE